MHALLLFFQTAMPFFCLPNCHIVCWSIETRDLLIRAPPVTFPRVDGKIKKIEMPEDVYVKKFFKKHPDSLYHDAIK